MVIFIVLPTWKIGLINKLTIWASAGQYVRTPHILLLQLMGYSDHGLPPAHQTSNLAWGTQLICVYPMALTIPLNSSWMPITFSRQFSAPAAPSPQSLTTTNAGWHLSYCLKSSGPLLGAGPYINGCQEAKKLRGHLLRTSAWTGQVLLGCKGNRLLFVTPTWGLNVEGCSCCAIGYLWWLVL